MSSYSFRSLDPHGAIALSHNVSCKDDLDALAEGVRRSKNWSVEIWHGIRLVARVKLGNIALNAADQRSL